MLTDEVNSNNVISIHALLAESDAVIKNSTAFSVFLSTLSLRRATTSVLPTIPDPTISIHALLAESDLADCTKIYAFGDFYPRSPCGERRMERLSTCTRKRFLSTLSLRRATRQNYECFEWIKFLSTLSLRRATASLVEMPRISAIFLSTLSLRRATRRFPGPRAVGWDFYPRSPCGERRNCWRSPHSWASFLSTLSLRRATIVTLLASIANFISIHALLAESDCGVARRPGPGVVFLSTLSLRRATYLATRE